MSEHIEHIFSILQKEYDEYQRTLNDDSVQRSFVEAWIIYEQILQELPHKVPDYFADKTVSFMFNEMGCKITLDPHTIKRVIVSMFLVDKGLNHG